MQEELKEKHLNNFDFLRFLAASLVIYSHAFTLSSNNSGDILYQISNNRLICSWIGVAIFFIISGYLVTQSYYNRSNVWKFIKARILRIYPALIVMSIMSVFVLGIMLTTLDIKTYLSDISIYKYILNSSIFISNNDIQYTLPGMFHNNIFTNSINGSLWTIPYEIKCYMILALIGLVGLIRFKYIPAILFLISIFLKTHSYLEDAMQYFFAGMCLYTYKDIIPLNKKIALSFAVLFVLFVYFGRSAMSVHLFLPYLVIYFAQHKKIRLYNFGKYGDFSYGLYIYAFPIQQTIVYLFGGRMNPYANMLLAFPTTLMLAFLSWHLIEKRCLKWK